MRISLNKALKRQMHELHTKAKEMAEETDPEKLKQWEDEQKVWLEIVAREEEAKRASVSPQPEDGSTEPQPEEGSQNLPLLMWSLATGQGPGASLQIAGA